MNYNELFEEFMKSCGYNFNDNEDDTNDDSENCTPPGVADEECRNGNSDIPGGFQDLNPQALIVLATILGIDIASKLPFNIQSAVGNFFELLGQVILTFNSQQQYFQGGPGRFYNPIYRNAANPFCPEAIDESSKNTTGNVRKTRKKDSKITQSNSALLERMKLLENEIARLKEEIENLK